MHNGFKISPKASRIEAKKLGVDDELLEQVMKFYSGSTMFKSLSTLVTA